MVTLYSGISLRAEEAIKPSWGPWEVSHLFHHGLTPGDTPKFTSLLSCLLQLYCWTLLQLKENSAGSHTHMAKG